MKYIKIILFLATAGLIIAQTNPSTFVKIEEQPRHGITNIITATNTEVDDQSIIRITFDTAKMAPSSPLVPGGPARPHVRVRVEAYSTKGSSRSPIAPIPHYVDLLPAPQDATTETTTQGTIVYHDKYFNPAIGAIGIPNTEFSLAGTQAGSADSVEIRITNLMTQESLITTLIPQKFGLHMKVTDSLMFIKRLGVNDSARTAGVETFNFGPAPGVTFGGTYWARKNGLVRFLQPGVGVNVLFTKWGDPALDISTGQFVKGTKASDIQTGMGAQFSLFNNVLQFTYGWNLQADQKRSYVGIGVSFVNVATKIGSLITK